MSDYLNWYPGNRVVEFVMIVSIAVTIISAGALIASLWLGRHPAIRHCLLLSALLIVSTIPLLTGAFIASGTSLVTLPLLSADDAKATTEVGNGNHFRNLGVAATNEALASPELRTQSGAAGNTAKTAIVKPTNWSTGKDATRIDVFQRAARYVLLLWVVGCALLLSRIVVNWLSLFPLYRSLQPLSNESFQTVASEAQQVLGIDRVPQIATSDRVRAPIALGFFRQIIILPAVSLSAISRDQLRDVLVHETAHIRGRDNLVLVLQAINKAVFWPILPVHLLNSALGQAREDVRDNSVLANRDPESYGETLLRLAELSRLVDSVAFSSGVFNWRGRLEDRIARLINHRRNTMTRTNNFVVALILGALLVPATLACGMSLICAPTDPDLTELTMPPVQSKPLEQKDVGTVTGRMLRNGKPVEGITVAMSQVDKSIGYSGKEYVAKTDKSGRFKFENVPQDDMYVYGKMLDLQKHGSSPVAKCKVLKGSKIDVGVLELQRSFRVSGTVRLDDGTPLPAKTQIVFQRLDELGMSPLDTITAKVAADGTFRVDGVPSALMDVSIRVKGYRYSNRNRSLDQLNGFSLQGTVKSDIPDLTILLEPGSRRHVKPRKLSRNDRRRFLDKMLALRTTRLQGVEPQTKP